jgi:hypothetical protein
MHTVYYNDANNIILGCLLVDEMAHGISDETAALFDDLLGWRSNPIKF